ncbi:MAG: hypothetical protein KH081_08855, partial [Azospirillum sp.]|nr:hypothetical protein [Azospirillum sp.]
LFEFGLSGCPGRVKIVLILTNLLQKSGFGRSFFMFACIFAENRIYWKKNLTDKQALGNTHGRKLSGNKQRRNLPHQ